jgi:hypothetical protein
MSAGLTVEEALAASRIADLEGRLEAAEALRDDPDLDGTDGAHPAFWRGQDDGVRGAVRVIKRALEGRDDGSGVVGYLGLQVLRQNVIKARGVRDAIRVKLQNAAEEHRERMTAEGYAAADALEEVAKKLL